MSRILLPITPLIAVSMFAAGACNAADPVCAEEAVVQGARLLAFHTDSDDRAHVSDDVRELAPVRNPANREQRFRVLELDGYVYKAQYRLRLLYADVGGECVLMGQEILEHANL